MSTSKWVVESHHINVKVGDCAIHLLTKSSNIIKAIEIHAAVLIDGGTASRKIPGLDQIGVSYDSPIRRMVNWINTCGRYTFSSGTTLKFDTIIITHWDEDHHGGLVNTLVEDAQRAVTSGTNIPYLKWSTETPAQPLTILYAPNAINSTGKGAQKLNGLPRRLSRKGPGTPTEQIEVATSLQEPKKYAFALSRYADVTVTGNALDPVWNVLGVNFFNNVKLETPRFAMKPSDLLLVNPPKSAGTADGRPGMYCIGVLQKTFTIPGKVGIVPSNSVTKTNRVSIAASIMWASQTLAINPPRCSHYFAGDLEDSFEKTVVNWLKDGGVDTLTSMKLSHHGSHSSTPMDLVRRFSPMNVIVSNPNGGYLHPAWEIVLVVAIWARLAELNPKFPRIWATKYPFYLSKNLKGEYTNVSVDPKKKVKVKVNMSAFLKSDSEFVTWLNDQYEGMRDPGNGAKSEYLIWKETQKAGGNLSALIMNLVLARWQQFCSPGPESMPATGSTVHPGMLTPTNSGLIESVVVYSTNDDSSDGTIYVKYYTLTSLSPVDRINPKHAEKSSEYIDRKTSPQGFTLYEEWLSNPKIRFRNALDDVDHALALSSRSAEDTFDPGVGTNPDEMDWDDESAFSGQDLNIQQSISIGQRGLPVLPGDPHPDAAWYIYSSLTSSSVIAPVTKDFSQTSNQSAWDGIIATLHSAVLALSQDPKGAAIGSTIPLDPIDEWAAWMQDSLGAEFFSMVMSDVASDAGIGGFEFTSQLLPMFAQKQAGNTSLPLLTFATDATTLINTFYPATPPPLGIRDGATALVFGLDPSRSSPAPNNLIKVSDMIAWVGLDQLQSSSFIAKIIGPMTLNLPTSSDEAKGLRNAVWFLPQAAYKTSARLEFALSPKSRVALNSAFSLLGPFKINGASLIARRSSIWSSGTTKVVLNSTGSLVLTAEFEFSSYGIIFDVNFELHQSSVVLVLILQSKSTEILRWLSNTLGIPSGAFEFTSWLSGATAGNVQLASFDFRRIQLEFTPDSLSGNLGFASLTLDMELQIICGSQKMLFLLTFRYVNHASAGNGISLEGDLWIAPIFNPDDPTLRLLPDFEDYAFLKPLTITNWDSWPKFLNLADLAGFKNVPSEIPSLVTQAKLLIGAGGISFTADVRANKPDSLHVPVISLDEVELAMSYQFKKEGTSGFAASLAVHIFLQANPTANQDYAGPAQILGSIDYAAGNWTLTGSVTNLWASTLYQFFNSDIQTAIAPVIESILIDLLDVSYFYDSTGKVSSLELEGQFHFGSIEMDLHYKNQPSDEDEKKSSWTFSAEADLNVNQGRTTTLGEVLQGLVGAATSDLPDFVTGVVISLAKEQDYIKLDLQSLPDTTPGLFLTATVQFATTISTFTFQYIQYCTADAAQKKQSLKRVFVASMSAIPTFSVPLIGPISQPFDEALFMWVQPQSEADGLTKADLDIINGMLAADILPSMPYKSVKKAPLETDILIKNGMHFMLVLKDNSGTPNVVLDYAFGQTTPPASKNERAEATEASNTDSSSGMVEYQKTVGGLSVRNLGFGFSASVLSVKLDATIAIGPVAFALLGATIKIDFSKSGASLNNLTLDIISFGIDGMAAVFDRPPLMLSGAFEAVSTQDFHGYEGAVSVAFQPWMFAAAGSYGTMTQGYTTAFVYAVLNGPLFTFEFAQITGVTGGFGYNTNLKLPSAAAVPSFPFITPPSSGPSPSPTDALEQLIGTGWFFHQQDCFWVAAGLTVEAFELLSIQAVVVVEWDPSVKLGLYGLATADIPSSIGGAGTSFAHVQLGIAATIDFGAGTMKINGQLTPSSYILDPNCHLVGGFALYSWFGNADPSMLGDWVFTLGGYHQKFVAPPQYPNPPRLGISWQFNDNISISGLSYFAITPKVCMGGGRLDVTLNLGPLFAFLDAYVDFLINFKPFHFIAEGGISVGVRFTLDLWLVTLHISVEIACQLYIEGPPIHGTVHVNFWVFGFDINFGQQSIAYPALTLDEFIQLVCSLSQPLQTMVETITSKTSIKESDPAPTPVENGKLHVFSVTNGLVPGGNTASQPSGDIWHVRAATFSFMISCKFAVDSIEVQTGDHSTDPPPPTKVPGTGNALHAKPMHENSVTSTITVTITADLPPSHKDRKLHTLADMSDILPVWSNDTGIIKSLPNGLWGQYDPNTDPSTNYNDKDLLDGTKGGTTPFLVGVNIVHPDPVLSVDDTTKPFDYIAMAVENAATVTFPVVLPAIPTFETEEPDKTGKQWANVAEKWVTPTGPVSSVDFVNLWADIGAALLGWDPEKIARKEGDNTLTGKAPTADLLKNIDGYLLWAPMMTQVAISA